MRLTTEQTPPWTTYKNGSYLLDLEQLSQYPHFYIAPLGEVTLVKTNPGFNSLFIRQISPPLKEYVIYPDQSTGFLHCMGRYTLDNLGPIFLTTAPIDRAT